MKILVFIKQVPDTVDVRIDPQTGNLDREGLKGVVNPFDLNAVEAALQLKEKHGGTVTVVSMGPPQTREALRWALAMGCDEAVLLSDRAFGGSDTLATGYTLALAARKIENCDLLLFGRHAVDADTGQTGPIVAEFLNLPQVTFAVSLEVEDGFAVCERLLDRAAETVRARLPALVTVCAEINKPRYPSPLGIMKSGRKPFFTWTHEDLGCDLSRTGKAGSPSVVGGIFEPERKKVETVLIAGDISEMAKQFVDILTERHLLQGGGCG